MINFFKTLFLINTCYVAELNIIGSILHENLVDKYKRLDQCTEAPGFKCIMEDWVSHLGLK
jgi:hypothetical protein